MPHRLAHLFRQLPIVGDNVLVVALVENDALRQAVFEHGRALVEPEQVRVFSLPDGLDVGQVIDHDHGVGHLVLKRFRDAGERVLGQPGKVVARNAVRHPVGLRPQRRRAPKRRDSVAIVEPDAHPPEQIPGRGVLFSVERLLREIGSRRHVAPAVGQPGGEPQPARVYPLRQGAKLVQRVGKPFGDCFDRAIRVTVAGLL